MPFLSPCSFLFLFPCFLSFFVPFSFVLLLVSLFFVVFCSFFFRFVACFLVYPCFVPFCSFLFFSFVLLLFSASVRAFLFPFLFFSLIWFLFLLCPSFFLLFASLCSFLPCCLGFVSSNPHQTRTNIWKRLLKIFSESGVAQWLAGWAHYPKVPGSKPGSAMHALIQDWPVPCHAAYPT